METEAQKKAHKKYETETVEAVKFRVRKGKRDLLAKCAKKNGESVNEMLNRLTDEEIQKTLGS